MDVTKNKLVAFLFEYFDLGTGVNRGPIAYCFKMSMVATVGVHCVIWVYTDRFRYF